MRFVFSLFAGALIWSGLGCGSFIWANRSTSGRSIPNPFGNCGERYVQNANEGVLRLTICICLAHLVELICILEQPMSSVMAYLPYLAEALKAISAERIPTYMGAFNGESVKPLKLYGTA